MGGVKIMKYYKQNNEVYAYELDGSQDQLIGDKVAMTAEEAEAHINPPKTMQEVIDNFTSVTTQYIEGKVTAYNQTNGLAFANIDAFTKYAINPLSQHYAIANQFITYADAIWKAVRDYQATATTIPTDVEFNAVLDAVVL
jgi:hypothetical protein